MIATQGRSRSALSSCTGKSAPAEGILAEGRRGMPSADDLIALMRGA
jgi:hypothetical protein